MVDIKIYTQETTDKEHELIITQYDTDRNVIRVQNEFYFNRHGFDFIELLVKVRSEKGWLGERLIATRDMTEQDKWDKINDIIDRLIKKLGYENI